MEGEGGFLAGMELYFFFFFKCTLTFGTVFDLQKNYGNNTEFPCILHSVFLIIILWYI